MIVDEARSYLTTHGFTRHPTVDRYGHRSGNATVEVVDAEAACFTVTAFTRDRARLIMWQAQLYKAPLPVFTATITAASEE